MIRQLMAETTLIDAELLCIMGTGERVPAELVTVGPAA
jgi:hypothetical protein